MCVVILLYAISSGCSCCQWFKIFFDSKRKLLKFLGPEKLAAQFEPDFPQKIPKQGLNFYDNLDLTF
jgi:hypothetical protein